MKMNINESYYFEHYPFKFYSKVCSQPTNLNIQPCSNCQNANSLERRIEILSDCVNLQFGYGLNEDDLVINSGHIVDDKIDDEVPNAHLFFKKQLENDKLLLLFSTPTSNNINSSFRNAKIILDSNPNNWIPQNYSDLFSQIVGHIETHTKYDGEHMRRVPKLVTGIMQILNEEIKNIDEIERGESEKQFLKEYKQRSKDTPQYQIMMQAAALGHDLGKGLIPIWLLNKEDRLSDLEFELMKRHAAYSGKIIENIPGMNVTHKVARKHHYRLDNQGYNLEDFDLSEQIIVDVGILYLADVFDALVNQRSYKPAFSFKKTWDIILDRECEIGRQPFKGSIHSGLYDVLPKIAHKINDYYSQNIRQID